ncbi:peptidase E [Streptomyces sp. RPA4-5]|uniref:Type 1 glutamine amidotransferase-like domain-containing protein n=1 Tax=Streptomyces TaxID=1883 RepID=UPI00143E2B47|nr:MULTISPECIES: peptidase E [Streptomyces]MCX4633603.1 peptidase E [Streptomyces platensis]QIY54852.1 peptidase E [Streptomyces sp. RPA4-5]WJY37524.1 peptidase E [Streptomyces sp. P9-2B-2]
MTGAPTLVLLGGGFSDDPDTLLDDFVRETAGRPRPKVCFLPTASGDAPGYIEKFHTAFGTRDCEPSHLELFRRTVTDLRAFVLAQDIVYVGGGNTANMLAVWRVHGLDGILREAYASGVLLCGISAGACCWFESAFSDSFGPPTPLADGLGLLPGSLCPHYDSEPERRPGYLAAVKDRALPAGWAVDDGAAGVFTDGRLVEVATRKPGATLRRVSVGADGAVTEVARPARLLGAQDLA